MPEEKKLTRKGALTFGLVYGAISLVVAWFGRGYSVGGLIPVPIFVLGLAMFLIVNVARAASD